jgi:hypothetical protein
LQLIDALCIISPSTEADMQITDWTLDPRVPALLDAMRETPPTKHWFKVPSRSSLFGRDDVFNYVHPAFTELNAIHNDYFKSLDLIDKEQGGEAYVTAARAFLADYPHPEHFAEKFAEQVMA